MTFCSTQYWNSSILSRVTLLLLTLDTMIKVLGVSHQNFFRYHPPLVERSSSGFMGVASLQKKTCPKLKISATINSVHCYYNNIQSKQSQYSKMISYVHIHSQILSTHQIIITFTSSNSSPLWIICFCTSCL